MGGWNIPRLHEPIARYFRTRRFRQFVESFDVNERTLVADVGGTAYYWAYAPVRPRVVIVNLEPPPPDPGGLRWVVADGAALPFRDGAVDVAFSNSVVEHIPGNAARRAYAQELERIGRRVYVQTPSRWFPIEPHLMTPLIHYLPKRWQRPLLRYFTVWGLLHKPTPEGCDEFLRDITLLTHAEMRALFPRAQMGRERVLGLTKSYVAMRR